MKFSKEQLDFLSAARVAILGTIDSSGRAHLVPIVYANTSDSIYFVIDRKRKKRNELKRLRNIRSNPNTTLLIDDYSEDWTKLRFLMLYCKAKILPAGTDRNENHIATQLLKRKYMQYRSGQYFPLEIIKAVFVKLKPIKAIYWQNLPNSLT